MQTRSTAATRRYRGLRLPVPPAPLGASVDALCEGLWQPDLTRAVMALARPDDRALVIGAGIGHIAALLAGKLGLPWVTVAEDDPWRCAYLADVARANGLCRLSLCRHDAAATFPATLVVCDLDSGPRRDTGAPNADAGPDTAGDEAAVGLPPAAAVLARLRDQATRRPGPRTVVLQLPESASEIPLGAFTPAFPDMTLRSDLSRRHCLAFERPASARS